MNLLIVVTVVVLGIVGDCHGDELKRCFYEKSCPLAEEIVQNITWKHVAANPALPAKFLRMHFHDCFVRGCDGSVLVDSTPDNQAEKAAIPNLSLAGFDVIDEIKTQLENACPGKVSCADIVALAARDSVSFQFKKSLWEVYTGRRDGNISHASEALANIPSPFSNFTTLQQDFANKNLSLHDLVVLSGAHTIGVGHCNLFSNRLYNFTGKGDSDPSLNSTYAAFLRTKCKSLSDTTTTVEMDPGSSLTFDSHYYTNLKLKDGLFQSDAALLTNHDASDLVDKLLVNEEFFAKFGESMKRMGAVGVLTVVVLGIVGDCHGDELKRCFYEKSCPLAEEIGCDGSVLVDSTPDNQAEKAAIPNLSLAGFDVIDEIKTQLENACPGKVSCADIVALAARDSVSFQFKKSLWEVYTGRRDGNISRALEALANIPSPFSNFTTLQQDFANKNLSLHDLVVLSGAHTIGVGHCNLFSNRLYNFTGKGDSDPSLNSTYAAFLRTKCKSLSDTTTTVEMDPGSSLSFDSHYYSNLKLNDGLFQSDAALLTNCDASDLVDKLLVNEEFFAKFGESMKRMGAVGVLTGDSGNIRKICTVVN
ncbi:hypothetical protein RHGRI_012462 [Rhododendron griersonianum]|uniref:peroxidase n=1 Tax=Rhododendron griersonianum TaxID=479676 RepID=A0AAV6KR28_9ERIC|nr:hypothetical protein RHGRI_012462 [Rhododendron griersonianum]